MRYTSAAVGDREVLGAGDECRRQPLGLADRADVRQAREQFAEQFLYPLLTEAEKLGMTIDEVKTMIEVWEKNR